MDRKPSGAVNYPRQIIIAWTEEGVVAVRERRTDLGERPALTLGMVAKAALWLNEGTADDVASAERYAAREGYRVFTFPMSEPDARGAAEKLVPLAAKPGR